jgi:uncharacterized damage-inducible protein DinB
MEQYFVDYLERLHDLHKDIRSAIEGLPQEALDWVPLNDANSIGAIIVHIAGSARYWIGDVAMEEPSNRDRDAEFRTKGLDETALLSRLESNEAYAQSVLGLLTVESLSQKRRPPNRDNTYSVGWALLHALEHTALHAGHIQIQRQMWDQRK